MRTTFIFTLVCAGCGQALELADRVASQEGAHTRAYKHMERAEGKAPTGAAFGAGEMRVNPCPICIDRATQSARKLGEALRELTAEYRTEEV